MFRRSKNETPEQTTDKGPGAKGRPTPTRKEAETAARERAKASQKSGSKRRKPARNAAGLTSAQVREGMKTGEDRYLPARDRGPLKRFVRNWIDSRITIAELLLPLLLIIMVLSYSGNTQMQQLGTSLWSVTLLVVILDVAFMVFRLRRALKVEFGGDKDKTKGATFYAMMRMIQLRWLRLPKPQVKVGGEPKVRR